MSNVLIIAKKEFSDLIGSRLVILILAFYVMIFSLSFYDIYGSININSLLSQSYSWYNIPDIIANPAGTFASDLIMIVCYYGSLVAVGLGYSSMSSEADGKALSTLLVKPLYRDTIINGKLLGAASLLFCIFWVSVAFYLSGLFLLFGGLISANILGFIGFLPLIFILYMLSTMLFLAISMLSCITLKEQSLALFISFLSWIFLVMLSDSTFMGSITSFFRLDQSTSYFIGSFVPYNILAYIGGIIVNGKGVIGTFSRNFSQIAIQVFALSFYCFITILTTYSSFLRRDVS